MNRKLLLIAASGVLILMLGAFTALGMYNRQQEQKLATAKTSVKQAVQKYSYNAQTSSDIEKSLGELYGQIQSLTIHTNAPGQSEFIKKSEEIRQSIAYLMEYSAYSKKVGVLLVGQQFGGKFISSDDALAQAKKWQDFNAALKKISAPVMVRKQHDVLVASTANQVVIATKASDAYKANDATTIAAQSKAANDELAKIQAVYDDVYALVRVQQGQIVVLSNKL